MPKDEELETTEETEVEETEESGEEITEEKSEGEKGQESAQTDDKEKNRKGFEIRQQQKAKKEGVITSLSKRLEETESKLKTMEENSKDLDWRKTHTEVSDELFNLIKSASKGSGKSYDDCLNDPVIKSHLETSQSKSRIEKSTTAPSTKTSPGGVKSVWDESPEEFQAHQEEVLRRG